MIKKLFFSLSFEIILIFLIFFTPLFYGSVRPLALAITQFAILVFFGLFLIKILVSDLKKIVLPPYTYFLLFFLALAIFQLISLPKSFLKIISPATLSLYQEYSFSYDQRLFFPLAFNYLSAKKEIVKFICFLIIFFGTINIFEKRRQFERIFLIIIFWGVILAFYGIVKKYFILNLEMTKSFSTFGNRNHFAGYMVMVAPLAVGYALQFKERTKRFLFGFSAALISASIFLSLSRAGSLSLVFALFLMVVILNRKQFIKEKYWVIAAAALLGIIFVAIAGFAPIKERFLALSQGIKGRWAIVRDSLAIVKDFPLLGVGWGNFSHIFPLYRRFVANYYYYLHNDHLQILVESGLIGSFLYFSFLFKIFKDILKELQKRRDIFVNSIVIGGTCGLIGTLFHSFFEFNFHIPANSFLFWLLLGLMYKSVHTHFIYSRRD